MIRGLPLSAIVVLVACSHEKVVPLADFQPSRLRVHVNRAGTDVSVWLEQPREYSPGRGSRVDGPCFLIEERVSATLDGVPMAVTSRGGYVGSSSPVDGIVPYCDSPMFQLATSTSPTPTSKLTMTDGTTTMTAVVRSLRTVRGFALSDALQRGTDAHFVWSVVADSVPPEPPGPCPGAQWSPAESTPPGNVPRGFYLGCGHGSPGARVEGNTLVLSIPADAAPGPGELSISSPFRPTVAVCEGVANCEASADGPPPLPTTLAP